MTARSAAVRTLFALPLVAAALFAGAAARAQETKSTSPSATEDKLVYVKMTTNKGDIVLELNETKAPITVANFLSYVDSGFYNGTIFHRVIPNFMIQGGGLTPDMTEKKTNDPIKNESPNGLKNVKGAIAMARLSQPDTASSQFFIDVKDNPFLDTPSEKTGNAAYAVFGQVVDGMEVVTAIEHVPTAKKGIHGDVPVEPVIIEKVVRLDNYEKKK